jgi:sensor histidine kinase regulating citrate/malate metabolism
LIKKAARLFLHPASIASTWGGGTVQSKLGTFNKSGFDLGHYITHELINKFQRKIWAENNNPSGTAFKFVLPVDEQN